jgi:hypothetical protein
MVHAMRSAWNAHRHWLAAGFLFSTSLFLLLIILNWRSEQRGINQQSANRALSNYVGHEIDVVTKKCSATVPLQAQEHGQRQWHNR